MNNIINGKEVYTIDNHNNHILIFDSYASDPQLKLDNMRNVTRLHLHISISDIEPWFRDFIASNPDTNSEAACGIVVFIKIHPPAEYVGEPPINGFKVFNDVSIDWDTYNEGDCVRLDCSFDTIYGIYERDFYDKRPLEITGGIDVTYILVTKFAPLDNTQLRLDGIIPTDLAEQMEIEGESGNGFKLNIHDMYFSDGVSVAKPSYGIVEDFEPGLEGERTLSTKDFSCSAFATKSYSNELHEYVSNLPDTLTLEFFHDYVPSNSTLLSVGNLYDKTGFQLDIDNMYESVQSYYQNTYEQYKYIRIQISYYMNNEYKTEEYIYRDMYEHVENHVIVELNTQESKIDIYYNKEVIFEHVLLNNQALKYNGQPLSIDILKKTFDVQKYFSQMFLEDCDVYFPTNIPDIQSPENWEDLYVIADDNDNSADYSSKGVNEFTKTTIKGGQERYAPKLIDDKTVILLKDHAERSYYYGFEETPVTVHLMLNVEDILDVDKIYIELRFENDTRYISISTWRLPYFEFAEGEERTKILVFAILFEDPRVDQDSEDVGLLHDIHIKSRGDGVCSLIDMMFCNGSGRVYPTPVYKETPW